MTQRPSLLMVRLEVARGNRPIGSRCCTVEVFPYELFTSVAGQRDPGVDISQGAAQGAEDYAS
jgi:hypothetical protein